MTYQLKSKKKVFELKMNFSSFEEKNLLFNEKRVVIQRL
jgi:hypothetical protein